MKVKSIVFVGIVLLLILVVLTSMCIVRYDLFDARALTGMAAQETVETNSDSDKTEIANEWSNRRDEVGVDDKTESTDKIEENKVPADEIHEEGDVMEIGTISTVNENEYSVYIEENTCIMDMFTLNGTNIIIGDRAENEGYGYEKIMMYSVKENKTIQRIDIPDDKMVYLDKFYTPNGVVMAFRYENGVRLYMYTGENLIYMNTLKCTMIYHLEYNEQGCFVLGAKGGDLVLMNLRYDMSVASSSTIGMMGKKYIGTFERGEYRYILLSDDDEGCVYRIYRGAYVSDVHTTLPFSEFALQTIAREQYLMLIDSNGDMVRLQYYDSDINECGTYSKKGCAFVALLCYKGEICLMLAKDEVTQRYTLNGMGLQLTEEYDHCVGGEVCQIYSNRILFVYDNGMTTAVAEGGRILSEVVVNGYDLHYDPVRDVAAYLRNETQKELRIVVDCGKIVDKGT